MANEASVYRLGIWTKLGYAAGHIFNDIAASILTSYSLLFFQNVIKIEKSMVGWIYLIGQLADGLASPTVGFLSDLNIDIWLCNSYGRRKVNLQLFAYL